MFYWLIPLIIGAILLVIFLYFRVKEKRVIAVVIKGLVSLMFIITAIVALLTSHNPSNVFGIFIIIGLCFGLLGDVFLDIKYIDLKHELLFTILGFFAFAFGHVAYMCGLFIVFFNFSLSVFYLIIPFIVAVILCTVTLLMEKFTPIRYENMKPFVVIYGAFLFFATSIYMSGAIQTGWNNTTLMIMAIAFIIFMLSDLILNNTYFAKGYSTAPYIIANHGLYYIAQFMIAMSLFFLL